MKKHVRLWAVMAIVMLLNFVTSMFTINKATDYESITQQDVKTVEHEMNQNLSNRQGREDVIGGNTKQEERSKKSSRGIIQGTLKSTPLPQLKPETQSNPQQKDTQVQNSDTNIHKIGRTQSKLQTDLYEYLMVLENRESVKKRAVQLNYGSESNSCVYFSSEALRRVGLEVPLKISFTGHVWGTNPHKPISFINQLQAMNWKVSKDLNMLLPGDIGFTAPNEDGSPTHVYVFMGWVQEGSQDFAYICDNQSFEYGATYHIRNIKNSLGGKNRLYQFMYTE